MIWRSGSIKIELSIFCYPGRKLLEVRGALESSGETKIHNEAGLFKRYAKRAPKGSPCQPKGAKRYSKSAKGEPKSTKRVPKWNAKQHKEH